MKSSDNTRFDLDQGCRNVIFANKHHILSVGLGYEWLIDDFLIHCNIDSSFNRLESIVLSGVSINRYMILLSYLKYLPRLFSMTIYSNEEGSCNLNSIYRSIFSLPSLKYNNLTLSSLWEHIYGTIHVPFVIDEKFNTIKYLVINHGFTTDELISMLYHTPKLCHLTCGKIVK